MSVQGAGVVFNGFEGFGVEQWLPSMCEEGVGFEVLGEGKLAQLCAGLGDVWDVW